MPPRAESAGRGRIEPQLRDYAAGDLDAVIEVFLRSVRESAHADYSPEQIGAWAQADRAVWAERRLAAPTWVAVSSDHIVGFADLEPSGHLNMLYVHPEHQRRGVATALVGRVEAAARALAISRIFTEASRTALPFFLGQGFALLTAQEVCIRGQSLTNYRMEKILADTAPASAERR